MICCGLQTSNSAGSAVHHCVAPSWIKEDYILEQISSMGGDIFLELGGGAQIFADHPRVGKTFSELRVIFFLSLTCKLMVKSLKYMAIFK